MIIKVANNLTVNSEKTYITNQEVAGTNVLRWKNPNVFSSSWAVQVGETGEEQSEIVLLGTAIPAGTAGTLTANTKFEHPSDTPMYAIKYDQIVFECSTAGTAGTATPLTDGTITITPDSKYTQFDHTTGSSTYAYKTYYRNSVLNVTTTESDWLTSAGYSFYSLAKIRDRIRNKLWESGYIKDDLVIDDWINEWKEKMTNAAVKVNEDYCLGTATVGYQGTAELGTITNADFRGRLKRVWISTDGVNSFQATKMDSNSYFPNQIFNGAHPYYYMQGDNVMGRKPNDGSGTATIEYYSVGQPMVNDTDELPASMRAYTKSFVNYGLAQAYYKDGRKDDGDGQIGEAYKELDDFTREIAPRNQSGPTFVQVIEDMGQNTNDWWFT